MKKIAFVGLGHMGQPMAQRLLSAGHAVIAYDLVPEAAQTLVEQGASTIDSLAELPAVDMIITMLQTGEQVHAVCAGEHGLFAHAAPATTFIDCSSIAVDDSRRLHQMASEQGFAMLDAPVSGGVAGAKAGTLTFMVGGDAAILEQIKPILAVMGQTIVHTGGPGNGQVAKICNNMVLGVSMVAVSEAFVLAQALGLSTEKLFEVCTHSSSDCWVFNHNVPMPGLLENAPANNDYTPGFTAKMMLKDLSLSQAAADLVQQKTPVGAKAKTLYQAFVDSGQGELDFSAIIKMLACERE